MSWYAATKSILTGVFGLLTPIFACGRSYLLDHFEGNERTQMGEEPRGTSTTLERGIVILKAVRLVGCRSLQPRTGESAIKMSLEELLMRSLDTRSKFKATGRRRLENDGKRRREIQENGRTHQRKTPRIEYIARACEKRASSCMSKATA